MRHKTSARKYLKVKIWFQELRKPTELISENLAKMSFPYKILNGLSSKLKSAETLVETEMKNFQVVEEYEAKMRESSSQTPRASAQYQETATPLLANRSVQTLVAQAINQASQTEPIDENSLLRDEVDRLRKVMAELVHENNRYHFRLSNCTC